MKAQVSRLTHRPDSRYGSVLLAQGRMVTDADVNEQAALARDHAVDGLVVTVGSGVPRDGGFVTVLPSEEIGRIGWGTVVVDGIHATVTPAPGAGAEFALGAQADLLAAEGSELVPGRAVYVDVWEQVITSVRQPRLVDPAWQGADTAFRTLVTAQVKQCPFDGLGRPVAADPAANPAIGSARLAARLRDGVASPDPCDPCAAELQLPEQAGNALFRLEVRDVDAPGDPADLTLAWSAENAAEQYRVDAPLPGWFTAGDHHYEFFDDRSEQNAGVFLDPPATWEIAAVPLVGDVTQPPARPGGGTWTGVRRWDGWCRLTRAGDVWTVVEGREFATDLAAGATAASVVDGVLVLPLTRLELRLTLAGGADPLTALRGDHWLVEVRGQEPAPAAAGDPDPRCHVVSETPVGIRHHYLVLGTWTDDGLQVADDDARRALSFPPLTDLRATHVGYSPDCPSGLFGDGETTVARALDLVCRLDASAVRYDGDCETVAAAETVQQAIDALCAALGRRADDCRPRLALFGRGVVCGLVPAGAVVEEPGRGVLDAVIDIVRAAPDRTRLSDEQFLRREAAPRSDARRALLERLRAAGDQLAHDDVRRAIRDIEPDLAGDELDRKLADVVDQLRGTRGFLGFRAFTFTADPGTVVDGRGCYHDVPQLSLTVVEQTWEQRIGVPPFDLGRVVRRLELLERERPGLQLTDDTWRADLASRVEAIARAAADVSGAGGDEPALRDRIAAIGPWRSSRLRDRVADVVVAEAAARLTPIEITGWLYLVFDDAARPGLEFRREAPAPWLHAPSMLRPAELKLTGTRADLSSVVQAAIDAMVAAEPQVGDRRPVVSEVLDAALDEDGMLRLGRLQATVADRFRTVAPDVRFDRRAVDDTVAGLLEGRHDQGGVQIELPRGRFTITPGLEVGGEIIPLKPVRPGVVVVGERRGEEPEDVWAPFRDVRCPQPNDGSVCLGRVGLFGDRVVIAPDDREQILTTPAHLNAEFVRAHRSPVFDRLFAAAKSRGG